MFTFLSRPACTLLLAATPLVAQRPAMATYGESYQGPKNPDGPGSAHG